MLAGVGTGVYKSVAEACDTAIQVKNIQQPDMALHSKYSKFYSMYGQLYKSLKKDYKDLADIMKSVYEEGV